VASARHASGGVPPTRAPRLAQRATHVCRNAGSGAASAPAVDQTPGQPRRSGRGRLGPGPRLGPASNPTPPTAPPAPNPEGRHHHRADTGHDGPLQGPQEGLPLDAVGLFRGRGATGQQRRAWGASRRSGRPWRHCTCGHPRLDRRHSSQAVPPTTRPPTHAPAPPHSGLQALLNQRRALLSYLRRSDFDAFCAVLHRLGLRDNNYARQVGGFPCFLPPEATPAPLEPSTLGAPCPCPPPSRASPPSVRGGPPLFTRSPPSAPGRACQDPSQQGACGSLSFFACRREPPAIPTPPRSATTNTESARGWGRPPSRSSGTASGDVGRRLAASARGALARRRGAAFARTALQLEGYRAPLRRVIARPAAGGSPCRSPGFNCKHKRGSPI
jgi:hypothetical protein